MQPISPSSSAAIRRLAAQHPLNRMHLLACALQAEAAAAAVDRAFGLHIAEAVRCCKCGRVTQEGRYTQVGVWGLDCCLCFVPA